MKVEELELKERILRMEVEMEWGVFLLNLMEDLRALIDYPDHLQYFSR
jgi:hypothetical protein